MHRFHTYFSISYRDDFLKRVLNFPIHKVSFSKTTFEKNHHNISQLDFKSGYLMQLTFLLFLQYEDHEEVVLWMNTVGPYHNRQETYKYFSLPFCKGPQQSISHHHETMGEALQGVELEFSGLEITFKGRYIVRGGNLY